MYKILKNNVLLTIVGTPVWVKKQTNGAFGVCQETDAQGVAVDSMVFHIYGKPEIEGVESVVVEKCDDGVYANNVNALLLDPADLKHAEQFRKAVQLFAGSLDEKSAMEIATIYDRWVVGKNYIEGDYLAYGENAVGDPQLYQVLQGHVSAAEWPPNAAPSLYKAVGITADGYPEWSQPVGASDAYNAGDVVSHKGELYESEVDGNVWEPGVYGWKKK